MSDKKKSKAVDENVAVAEHDHDHHDHDHHDHDHDHDHGHHHHDDHHGHEHNWDFVEDPSFEVEYKGECVYEVGVKIPAANRAHRAESVFDELMSGAEIKGFRRGKAPKPLVQAKFSKAVKADVFQKLVGEAFDKMVHDEGLRPMSMPDIDGVEAALEKEEDADIELTFKFEVAPRCTLGDYTGLKVERPVLEIEPKDVDAALEDVRSRFAYFEAVEKGKSQDGDQVVIDFEGRIDGEVFPGGSAENYPYFIGSKRFFPEFEAALVGAKAGAEVEAVVTFPEDYHGKDVAGKTATFKIKINEIKRRVLPEIDDDMAKEMGYENAVDMREKVAADLRVGASEQSKRITESRLVKQIVDNSTFELPPSLIESSALEYYRQELRRLAEMRVPPAEVQKRDAMIREQARENALENIKSYIVIGEIGQKEGVTVTESDFAEEASMIQARTGMKMEVVEKFLSGEEQRSNYEDRIFRRKALQIVMNAAEIKDVVVSQDELDEQAQEASDEE
ncbi:MAG: hypothetical protein RLZZ303_1344 [Candidatus Hydrogenedentota bacterium]|jgi:trigger factor